MVTEPTLRELQQLIARHAFSANLCIPGLKLVSLDTTSEPTSSIAEPALALVAQGAKRLAIGDRVYEYGAGDYLVVSLDLPVTGQFTAASRKVPFLGLSLTLKPYAIASLLVEAMPDRSHLRPVRAEPALGVGHADGALLDALVRLLRLLDHPRDARVLAPLLEKEVLWRLLNGTEGELLRQIGTSDGTLWRVSHAVRWIRDHYAQPFRVEDLAEHANMSVSSFHRHFRLATTMGPLQYQKKVRLQQARLLLAGSRGDITRIAYDVGYQSPSQFSREYRREFGLPPGRDLAAIAKVEALEAAAPP